MKAVGKDSVSVREERQSPFYKERKMKDRKDEEKGKVAHRHPHGRLKGLIPTKMPLEDRRRSLKV